jgi:hypothetical protein
MRMISTSILEVRITVKKKNNNLEVRIDIKYSCLFNFLKVKFMN